MNSFIEENIKGTKVEKAFNHQEINYSKFDKINKDVQSTSTEAFYRTQMNVPVIVALSYFNFSVSCVLGVIFAYKGLLVGGVAALTSYLVYVRQSARPFNFITQHVNSILSALAGSERIFNFLDIPEEIDKGNITLVKINSDKDFSYAWKIPNLNNKEYDLIPLKGEIKFINVSFGYLENQNILKNINFTAEPGQKIAFVGSTGAGKTTIISLISRLYEINKGSILYDGIDIKDIKKNL